MPEQHSADAPRASVKPAGKIAGPGSLGELEAGQVRSMFDRIAGVYDLLNGVMTAGLHHHWRERAVDLAQVGAGSRVLDVATGTGDLALELARRVAPGGEVVGSDFSEGMLARARTKSTPPGALLRFEWGDALELPYAQDSFDAATVGFGARNFSDLGQGLSELARVVRPGGKVVVLELTSPKRPPLSLFYELWFDRLVPLIGWLTGALTAAIQRVLPASRRAPDRVAQIADAYTYLPNSVKRFADPATLAAELERVGLCEIRYVLLAGGIISIHTGTVAPVSSGSSSGSDAGTSAAVAPGSREQPHIGER